jgi:hypothetical protein
MSFPSAPMEFGKNSAMHWAALIENDKFLRVLDKKNGNNLILVKLVLQALGRVYADRN